MAAGAGGEAGGGKDDPSRLAPFNPTSDASIEAALELLALKDGERVLDVGCGDARFLVAAAKRTTCTGEGVEWDEALVERGAASIEREGLGDRVRLRCGDATVLDWGEPDAIFLYLVPDGLRRIAPQVRAHLLRGARIVTNIFSIPELVPVAERTVGPVKVRLYTAKSVCAS
jgi:precorrin-6B methylase 2